MKFICHFLLFFPVVLYAQTTTHSAKTKDTVIIIPLGNSAIYAQPMEYSVKGINAGMYHCSVIDHNNHLTTWIDPRAYAIQAPVIQDKVRSIATGDIHSVVLYSDSTINQFFLIPQINMFYPYQLSGVVEVQAGPNISTALTKKGILYAWAPGKTIKNLNIPIKTYGVKQTSVGKSHIAFINIKNKVFVWGDHSLGQNNKPVFKSKPIQIASGDYHTIVLDELKNIYVWGNNSKGQCVIPAYTGKIDRIAAKNFYTLIQLDNNTIIVWGMGKIIESDFSSLGKVKSSILGHDFAVVVVESNQEKITEWYFRKTILDATVVKHQDSSMFAADSLTGNTGNVTSGNFIKEALIDDFAQAYGSGNLLEIESLYSSQTDDNSSTSIAFEGSGNNLKIINDRVTTYRKNSTQRIIVKGSNQSATLRIQNQNTTVNNEHSTVVIDLNALSNEGSYPEEYVNPAETMVYQQDQIIDFDSLPNSMITEWPVENGIYWIDGENMGHIGDPEDVLLTIDTRSDPFQRAQGHFYFKDYTNGITILQEAAADPYYRICALALFEIYYYGLFDQKISLEKANFYYAKYNTK
ncbi:MAG: hypothetical protein H7259_06315 [Cytophagales bacterium]|nr:hypothetical protein [Cytophaga sp.]